MIAPYYDHELAVYQIVLFVEMKIGDRKSPQGFKKIKRGRKNAKKIAWRYHHFETLLDMKPVPWTTDSTLGYLKAVIFLPILPNLSKAWKKKLINEKFIIKDRIFFFLISSQRREAVS